MTVTGGAIANPKNLRVPLGTPVAALIDFCGGFSQEPARLVSGGPMMGQPLPSTRVPMVEGSNGVLALTAAEVHARDRAKQKQAETKRLADSRAARIEAIQAAKREAMARRKREAAAPPPAAQAARPQAAEAQA